VRNHGGISGLLGHFNGVQSLGDRADLVELDQNGVGHARVNALGQNGRVGDKDVVAHELHGISQLERQIPPTVPILFAQAVLNGQDRILGRKFTQPVDHFGRGEGLVFAGQHIAAIAEKLGGGRVYAQSHFVAGLITGFLNGLDQVAESLFVILQVGGETAFVAHAGGMAVRMQNGFQGMKDLGPDAQGIAECLGAHRQDHEFLDVQTVVRMGAAVDHVHERHGQHLGVDAAQILMKRQGEKLAGGPGRGHGYAEHGVGPQAALVLRAVQVNQSIVDLHLAQGIHADDGFGDFAVHMFHGLEHALALVPFFIAIAQFQGFARARGRARRHGGPSHMAGFKGNFHFHRGIAA